MSFTPRTFEEIRDDAIAYVRMQTDLTDFEVGSVIRTIIEAAALEDDEQYFQMVQLLDAFRLSSSTGQDLDDRVADFNIVRLQPQSATGYIVIQNGNLVTSTLSFNTIPGATTVLVGNSTKFPTSGFPVNVRIGEGTTLVEDNTITGNNTTTGQLTFGSALNNSHSVGDRVSVVSGTNIQLVPGIRGQVPATSTSPAVVFVSVDTGTLVAGNLSSTPIKVRAEIPGTAGNVGTAQITQFVSSPPFDGAALTNQSNTSGGRDIESDDELRDRAFASIQSLSRGTVLTLQQGVLGVEDPVTSQRVTTSNVLESFVTNEVTVYVDDGTGFTPDEVELARTFLHTNIGIAASSVVLDDVSNYPSQGVLIIEPSDLSKMEIIAFTAVNYATNTVTLATITAHAHIAGVEVSVVDQLTSNAESGESFFDLSKSPVVRASFRLWVKPPSQNPQLMTEDTDYFLNRGVGQIEFIGSGVAAGSAVIASYSYYTGLIAQVQKVINGDPTDPTNYPGLRAGGVRVIADTPVIRRVSVRLAISAKHGFQEQDLVPSVRETVEAYINGLGIGADVVLAEIIRRVMSVTGVADVVVSLPTSNVVVLENELPRPIDAAGTSLVSVN